MLWFITKLMSKLITFSNVINGANAEWMAGETLLSSSGVANSSSISNLHRAAHFWRQTQAPGLPGPPQQRLPGGRARRLLRRAAQELREHAPGQTQEPDPAREALVPPGGCSVLFPEAAGEASATHLLSYRYGGHGNSVSQSTPPLHRPLLWST